MNLTVNFLQRDFTQAKPKPKVGIDFSKLTTGMGEIGVLMSSKLYPIITVPDLISRAIIVVVIATIASLYPAWQASRKEPAQALHHV